MANCYITAEPCSLKQFAEAAESESFELHWHGNGDYITSMSHVDGRGCHGVSEETHDGETYVGSMGDPQLRHIVMVEEGSDEYQRIYSDEWDG